MVLRAWVILLTTVCIVIAAMGRPASAQRRTSARRTSSTVPSALHTAVDTALREPLLGACLALAPVRTAELTLRFEVNARDARSAFARATSDDPITRYCLETYFAPQRVAVPGAARRVHVEGRVTTDATSGSATFELRRVTEERSVLGGGLGMFLSEPASSPTPPFEVRRPNQLALFGGGVRAHTESGPALAQLTGVSAVAAMERLAAYTLHPCAQRATHGAAAIVLHTEVRTGGIVTVDARPGSLGSEPLVLACIAERGPAHARFLKALLGDTPVELMHELELSIRMPEPHELPTRPSSYIGERGSR